jgi:hypothetical protein
MTLAHEGPPPLTTQQPCTVHNKHTPTSHINHEHHVWPLGHGGPDIAENKIVVCPTGHYNIHALLQEYLTAHGDVPYSLVKTYGKGERDAAKLGYDRITRQAM